MIWWQILSTAVCRGPLLHSQQRFALHTQRQVFAEEIDDGCHSAMASSLSSDHFSGTVREPRLHQDLPSAGAQALHGGGADAERQEVHRQALHKCQRYLSRIVIEVHALAQVHRHCTEVGLTQEEQEVRTQALYIIDNLNLVNLAMRLCDFKDIHMAVEAKQVRAHPCWTL